MRKRWYEIPEETVALMAERCDQGDSFSKIGRDLGIDRRAVAKAVQQFKDRQSGRAAIRPGVLAQLFRGHLDDMEKAATVFLELTASPSLRGSLLPNEPNIKARLAARVPVEFARRGGEPTIYPRPPHMTPAEKAEFELRQRVHLRLAQRKWEAAIEGLKEHIPFLQGKIEEWGEAAVSYKESWGQLKEQAVSVGMPPDLVEPSVELALKEISALDEEESLPRFRGERTATNDPGYFANILLQRPATRRSLQIFWQNRKQLNIICGELEEMLSPPQLEKALVTAHCRYCPVP